MKLIVAIVRPVTIERMVVGFEDIDNFPGLTISDAAGFGRGPRSAPIDVLDPFRQGKKIEIVCDDEMTEQIVGVLKNLAHTGKKGDGFIMVLPVEDAIPI